MCFKNPYLKAVEIAKWGAKSSYSFFLVDQYKATTK